MDFLCEVKTGLAVDENSSDGFTLGGECSRLTWSVGENHIGENDFDAGRHRP
jgi:hypothetical protein